MTLRRLADRSERGLATVEAVLVVPLVLVPILLAVVVFGRLEHTRLVVDAAPSSRLRSFSRRLRSAASMVCGTPVPT